MRVFFVRRVGTLVVSSFQVPKIGRFPEPALAGYFGGGVSLR